MEKEKYYIHDYESGWPFEVTKEQWERHMAIRAHFAEKMRIMAQDQQIGKVIIFGTAGEMDGHNKTFQEMFYNPEKFNLHDNRNQWEETTRQGYFIPAHTKTDVQD